MMPRSQLLAQRDGLRTRGSLPLANRTNARPGCSSLIRQDVKDSNDNYIAILEAYIDGKKVETIEMPYDYIDVYKRQGHTSCRLLYSCKNVSECRSMVRYSNV